MFWIVAAVVVIVLAALAWWSSGRAPGSARSTDVRAEGEAKAMKHYNPPPPQGGGFISGP